MSAAYFVRNPKTDKGSTSTLPVLVSEAPFSGSNTVFQFNLQRKKNTIMIIWLWI